MNKTSNPTKRSSSKRGGRTLGVRPVRLSPVKATVVVGTTLLFMAVSFLPNVGSAWLYLAASGLLVLMGIRNLILYAILEKRRPNYARILELERATFAEEDHPPPPHTGSPFALDRRLIGVEEQATRHNGVRPNLSSPSTASQHEWNNALLSNLPTTKCLHPRLVLSEVDDWQAGDTTYRCVACRALVRCRVRTYWRDWDKCVHSSLYASVEWKGTYYCVQCPALVQQSQEEGDDAPWLRLPPPPPAPPAPWGKSGAKRVPNGCQSARRA